MEAPKGRSPVPPGIPPRIAMPVQPLDYRRPEANERKPTLHPILQSLLAIIAFGGVLTMAIRIGLVPAIIFLVALLSFGAFARMRWRWKGFFPALLLYAFVTLLLVGGCFVLFSTR
jgi:hypothetical protein